MRRVFLLGIDGGCLDLIKTWKEELPNFKLFLDSGVYGTLESTLPPITSPAWNCMFTGKNPAKIGLYDFYVFSFDQKDLVMVNSTYQDSPSLWESLSRFGVKVGVVNVPNTYPPSEVNGFMVCGGILNTLTRSTSFTYPAELKKELDRVVEGYEILPLSDILIPGKEEEYYREFDNILDKQVKAVDYLMKKHPWDFFSYVIFETDSVQHYFWRHLDQNHPKWVAEKSKLYGDSIKRFYKKVDGVLGKLMEQCGKETNIVVVSDHGFGPLYGHFCINEWLKHKGYLKLKPRTISYTVKHVFQRTLGRVRNFMLNHFGNEALKIVLRLIPQSLLQKYTFRGQKKNECKRLLDSIDWSRTKAFGLRMGIYINVKGRGSDGIVRPGQEYEELREEIMKSLREVRHPSTGEKIVSHIFKKEEVYSGKHLNEAPDLMYIVDGMRYRPIEGVDYGRFFIESPLSGDHRLQGMFMAHGPDFRKVGEEVKGIKIYDVTPTILHFFGMPISKEIDGRVLKEIFAPDSKPGIAPITYEKTEERKTAGKKEAAYSSEDERMIKEKLSKLGYL